MDSIVKDNNFSKADIQTFIDSMCLISNHQKINFMWRPFFKNGDDDMVLEVTFNAGADYIVTHNIKDFEGVEENFNIKICTTKEFLIIIGELK